MAKRWTELYPNDFQKIILINTSFKGINPLFNRLRPNAILNFINIFLTPQIHKREEKIIKLVSNTADKQQDTIKKWIGIQESNPVSRISFINQIKAGLSFTPSNEKIKIPLKVIASAKDRLCSVESSKKIHQIWGGTYIEHEFAGHDIPMDDPEWLIKEIMNFCHS